MRAANRIKQNRMTKEKQPLPEEMKNQKKKKKHIPLIFVSNTTPELCGQNLIFHIKQSGGVRAHSSMQ